MGKTHNVLFLEQFKIQHTLPILCSSILAHNESRCIWTHERIKLKHPKGGKHMTQMGLDYRQLVETQRHNVADEGIRSDTLTETTRHNKVDESVRQGTLAETARHNFITEGIQQQDADTRTYVASFKPREVETARIQANASASQANTAAKRQQLEADYKEREMLVQEAQAQAATDQATQAKIRNIISNLSDSEAAAFATELRGGNLGNQVGSSVLSYLEGLRPSFGAKVGK